MQKTSNFARRLCNLPVTEGMVQEMRQVFVDNPLMQAALMDPTVSQQEKEGVINRLFPQEFRIFLGDLAKQGGIGEIGVICDEFLRLRDERNQIIKATLTCVNEPEEEQLEKIRKFIITKYNCKKAEIEILKDESLIGGFKLQVKDQIFDWNTALNFQGETGPYIQYTYVRTKSVLEKAGYLPKMDEIKIESIKRGIYGKNSRNWDTGF